MRKHPLKALLPILLAALFLFNTLIVVAAEVDESLPSESPAVTDSGQPSLPDESEPPLVPDTEPEETPDATPTDDLEGGAELPENSAPEELPLVWTEVGTFEELYAALAATTPSETTRIRLTNNITIPKIESECASKPNHSIELDLGPYTLYVEGTLRLQIGLTLTGSASEDALIRVQPGGEANIHNVPIQASDRCAVWQEEGAVFTFTPTPDFSEEVHYAEKAVAMPHSFLSWQVATPVAVVHDGQTLAEVLPDRDSVHLYPNDGTNIPDQNIAVDWDVDTYQAELDTRVRTLITGSYPDAIALQQPVCLVVFQNGNPAIFLDAYGMESYGRPKAKVKIELLEPELGSRFEWSQDDETWLPADAVETPTWDGRLAFTVSFPQETPPAYPYYLSAVVDYPDGSAGYSDVLVIQKADSQCDSGGNRRGGTGVTPPELPPLGGSMDGAIPDEPDHSGESEGSKPPEGEEDGEADGTQPPELPPLGGSMDGATPDEPDHSGESEGSKPPEGEGDGEADGTQPPVVNPPIENDSPEQIISATEMPEQSAPPAGSEPPAQSTPPVIATPIPPLAADPPASAAVESVSPNVSQTGDGTATATTSSTQPEPSPSASPQIPDTTLIPDTQATADVQEAMTSVVTEVKPPIRNGGAPGVKPLAQIAAGVIATGGIITLTMTWGSWSKRLIGLLHKLLKR